MKQYLVDAFSDTIFHGNPAAVCILDRWLPEATMQNIAGENNLSETAFAVKEEDTYLLRWFTPKGEIDLCGHATLATAYVLLRFFEPNAEEVIFNTLSGHLMVHRQDDLLEMDFPSFQLRSVPVTTALTEALGAKPLEAYLGRDLIAVMGNEEIVRSLVPNQQKLQLLDGLLLHVTAPGGEADCVSRSFAPKCGVSEDPVCGSGHCHIIPYWSQKLGKND